MIITTDLRLGVMMRGEVVGMIEIMTSLGAYWA
jgi:hypothetical protein